METEIKSELPPYDLPKLTFFGSVHLIALLGLILWLMSVPTLHCSWKSWILALVWFELSCSAITAGYHRLFSHPTYRATRALKIFYLIWGEAAMQGSVLDWASKHRAHHKYVDTDRDPYNIKRGFWYAHWGWVVRKTYSDFKLIPDLTRDPLVALQHRFDMPIAIVVTFVIPTLIGALWDEALGTLFLVGFLRLVIQWHMTFFVNSIAHYWGDQEYSTTNSSRGSKLTAILTHGEGGSHNYHHAHPGDFRTGIHWYNYDPAKWFIWLCSKVGLASKLQRAKVKLA